ncbi:MAG TPA: bifunctional riboflavin kinase/FAD synthetase [Gammaproteobacteria bacterium]|nr:bifunctional riboflavin kinase/FAD synthetase [Gammaproteobacteria bacterium]
MELIRGLHNLRARHRGSAVTIGNFDGMHLGHQAMLKQLRARARALGAKATVMIFEPAPREFFEGDAAPARLSSLREKYVALAAAGAEQVLVVRFDRAFSHLAPQDFIQRLLIDGLGARYVLVGDDFRFGHQRAGDFATLEAAGAQHGFEVAAVPTVEVDGARVSSTRVRAALAAHDFELARRLLGRDYSICGRVRHGNELGRELGFPTANFALKRRVSPVNGIYVVRVRGIGYGVASVGTRPTVQGRDRLLEVYCYDFDGDLYGRHLEVGFLHWLRDEVKFPDVKTMRKQIAMDAEQGRDWLVSSARTHDNHD